VTEEAGKGGLGVKKKRLLGCAALVLVLGILGVVGGRWLFVHPYRRELPWSAEVIAEDSWSEPGPLSQDFTYSLSARLSEEEFLAYVQRLGLKQYHPSRSAKPKALSPVYELLPCEESDLGWWKEPGAYEHVYGQYYGKSGWGFVRFSKGKIWAVSGNI